jgi:energy-coupling factor transporter ATP-binding protein EcfA2
MNPNATPDTPAQAPTRLQLSGITKRYPAVVANCGVSLTVQPGEIHAVLGENGAGKSTLMKIIYGTVKPDEGSVQFDGRPVQHAQPAGGAATGHCHGVPAFQPVRHPHRGRKRLAGAGQKPVAGRSYAQHCCQGGRVRPGGGPTAPRAHPERGRDAARGNHPRAAGQPTPADPGRAHLGAHAAGGGQTLCGAAQAGQRGLQHPLHQPQAARDPRAVQRLHGDARGPGDGRVQPARGIQRLALAPDDRRRAARAGAPCRAHR